MGLYLEKIEENEKKIKKLKTTIETSKAKLKKLVDENAHLSYLEIKAEYNCKPRELDEIITSEHSLLQKLRASGLSDSDLLKLVGNGNVGNSNSNSYQDDDISFYDNSENDEE